MSTRWNTRASWALATIFLFAAAISAGQTFEVVHSFTAEEGSDPQAGIVQLSNGDFAGTTVEGLGTLFKMDSQGRLGTIYYFKGSEDGANPHAPLAVAPDGLLYGTTMYGLAGWGGVYSLDGAGTLAVLKSFVPGPKGPEGEGAVPHAPLLLIADAPASDGMFYGVTTRGGMDDLGTIYSMDAAHNVRTLRHFSGWDGALPFEALIQHDGYLYGTTTKGGATDSGTIFRIGLGGSNFQVVHNFGMASGIEPEAPLIALNGLLYGTTSWGGRFGMGTVFKVEPSGAGYSVIHHFTGFDGANPHAALLKARDGYLYGTTSSGGTNFHGSYGNVFRMSWTGQDFSILHRFGGFDGVFSQSRLIEASDGALYGTTSLGGRENRGVVFRLVFVPVASITPSSGPAGGTPVTVSGANFQPGADLTFAGVAATDVVIKTDSQIGAVTPALEAGTLNDVIVDNLDRTRGGILRGFFADFLDVPQADILHPYVEKVFRNRITAGIGSGHYGRNLSATRAQMAVFVLKAKHGPFYVPPPATGMVFDDVPSDDRFASWIEQLSSEGITEGCNGGSLYCPYDPMTREQLAVVLLKAKHGANYTPPGCRNTFIDVPCSSVWAPWIDQLYAERITDGCFNDGGILFYCPNSPTTRGQTAVFLTKTFELP